MLRALAGFRDTLKAYGQQLPDAIFTDNVTGDRELFSSEFNLSEL